MRTDTWYEVTCDKCGRHLRDFGSDMQQDEDDAIEIAETQGWKYDEERDENICPLCSK